MGIEKDQIDRALRDLEAIKRTLQEDDKEPVLKSWVFFSWAGVIAVATVASRLVATLGVQLSTPKLERLILLSVWLPAILIGGCLEIVAWISKVRSDHGFALTDRTKRFLASGIGVMACAGVLIWELLGSGLPVAGPVLLLGAIVNFLYCEFSFPEAFPEVFALAGAGIVATVLGLGGLDWNTAAGLLTAAVMSVAGIRYRRRSRRV